MKKKAVIQYSKTYEELGRFECIHDAEKEYGITHVSQVCRKKRRTDGGFIWRYEDDATRNANERIRGEDEMKR